MALSIALPKVSIVIPVYNGGDYVKEAIDSALAQTYENLEILVVNDGSVDNGHTEAVARSYGSQIRYFAKENGGTASALNMGIQNMKGDYFSWLSHDDLYEPEKVRLQVEALRGAGDDVVCACYAATLMPDGRRWGVSRVSQRITRSLRAFLALDKESGLNGCCLLIPKSVFAWCGLFDETKLCTQDYDMWWRMAEACQVKLLKRPLVGYRCHENQTSLLWRKRSFEEADILRMRMIQSLSMEEVERYLAGDPKSLAHSYTNYVNDGFPKAAAATILCGYRWFASQGKEQRARSLLAKGVLGDKDMALVPVLERMRGAAKKRPRLMVFCEAWGSGPKEQGIADWMKALRDSYELVAVLWQKAEHALPLPEGVMELAIGASSMAMADVLLRLGMFLGVDALISHAQESHLALYPAFAGSGIPMVRANEAALSGGQAFGRWKALLSGLLSGQADEAASELTIPEEAFEAPDAPSLALATAKTSLLLRVKTSKLMRPLRGAKYWLRRERARRNPVWR